MRGRRCQTLRRICTQAPLIASLASPSLPFSPLPLLNPSGKQQNSRPRLVPRSNTRSRSSQLASRIQRGEKNDAVTQQPGRAETAVQQAQAGTQAETGQPISTLYLMLMWYPSNRLYQSVCCIFALPSSHFPQSCTVLLFALITVSPLLQAAIIFSPEKIGRTQGKKVFCNDSIQFQIQISCKPSDTKQQHGMGRKASKLLSIYIYQKSMIYFLPANICMQLKKRMF